MNLFYKITYIFVFILLVSCQEEVNEESLNEPASNQTKSLTEASISNLEKLIVNTESSIQYPVTVTTFYTDSQQTGSANFENDTDLYNYLQSLNNNNVLVNLKYPITYWDKNQKEVTLTNNQGLKTVSDLILVPKNEDYLTSEMITKIKSLEETNSTFSYPLEFKIRVKIQSSNPTITTKTINNKQELMGLLSKEDKDHRSFAIVYPINVYGNLQNQIVLKNNKDLLDLEISASENEQKPIKDLKNVSNELVMLLNKYVESGSIQSLLLNVSYTKANNSANKFVDFDVDLEQYKQIIRGGFTNVLIGYHFYINNVVVYNDAELLNYLNSLENSNENEQNNEAPEDLKNVSNELVMLLNKYVESGSVRSLLLNVSYTDANNSASKFIDFDIDLEQYKQIIEGGFTNIRIGYHFYINDVVLYNDAELLNYLNLLNNSNEQNSNVNLQSNFMFQ